jgi:hypothetical protein
MVRDLKGTFERENAAIGLFITLEEPTREMQLEANTAGLFHSELWNRAYPRIQPISIADILRAEVPSARRRPAELPTSREGPVGERRPAGDVRVTRRRRSIWWQRSLAAKLVEAVGIGARELVLESCPWHAGRPRT